MRLLFCFPKKVAQLAATTSLISFPETNINMGKLTLYPETRMVELDEEALSSQTSDASLTSSMSRIILCQESFSRDRTMRDRYSFVDSDA